MLKMEKARAARLENLLDKAICLDNGQILTWRQATEQGLFVETEIGEKPSIQFSRAKFNRMNNVEQAEYQKKLDKMVPEYRVFTQPKSEQGNRLSFYEPSKMVFEWIEAQLKERV